MKRKSRLLPAFAMLVLASAVLGGVGVLWLELHPDLVDDFMAGGWIPDDDSPPDDEPDDSDDDPPPPAVPKPGKSFTNEPGMKMVWIPAGKFLMGRANEQEPCNGQPTPEHEVKLEGFWMGKYEVTHTQYAKLMPVRLDSDRAHLPALNVGYTDALEFARQLTATDAQAGRLPIGSRYTLPSEAQWEYAGRAGATTRYHMGDGIDAEQAAVRIEAPMDVGSYPPNAFGLHDIHGNAREWCLDKWHTSYDGAPRDGSAWVTNPDRPIKDGGSMITPHVVRGGSYFGPHRNAGFGCRWFLYDHGPAASRRGSYDRQTGLRVVLTPPTANGAPRGPEPASASPGRSTRTLSA